MSLIIPITSTEKTPTKRILSIDILRGFVMVLMVLDHVRDFLTKINFRATDLTKTNEFLFLTRWITHLCAPTFIFLAGLSTYLYFKNRLKTKQELSQYLLTRGIFLIVLELTVIHFAWMFDPTFSVNIVGVIWAIGWSMIVLAGLIYLPIHIIATIGILLIFGHNLFDHIHADQLGRYGFLWSIFHEPKMFTIFTNKKFFVGYPLIPWIGVMATGYCLGPIFYLPKNQRLQFLGKLGICLILSFLVIRGLNIYGDPVPWSQQRNFSMSILSFINCTKYPPSLLYLLMTLGIAIILLYLFEKIEWRIFKSLSKPLILFGQVPLFFYVVHLWIVHFMAIFLALPQYGLKAITLPFLSASMPKNYGYELPIIYGIWIIIIVILYPICNYFIDYKSKHPTKWLQFF
jgi:uncharacterized membrane protein